MQALKSRVPSSSSRPVHEEGVCCPAGFGKHRGGPAGIWSGKRFGELAGFVEAVEAIAGDGAFREHGESSAVARRFLDRRNDPREVLFVLADSDVHLDAGDFEHDGWNRSGKRTTSSRHY
jgi:hypothetical protein